MKETHEKASGEEGGEGGGGIGREVDELGEMDGEGASEEASGSRPRTRGAMRRARQDRNEGMGVELGTRLAGQSSLM